MKTFVRIQEIKAVKWTGKNYKEVVNFLRDAGEEVSWSSSSLYWDESNVPEDLEIIVNVKGSYMEIPKGCYIAKTNGISEAFLVSEKDFEKECIEVENE